MLSLVVARPRSELGYCSLNHHVGKIPPRRSIDARLRHGLRSGGSCVATEFASRHTSVVAGPYGVSHFGNSFIFACDEFLYAGIILAGVTGVQPCEKFPVRRKCGCLRAFALEYSVLRILHVQDFAVKVAPQNPPSGVKSFRAGFTRIAFNGDSGMFVEEPRDGNCGKGIGRGTPGFPSLKSAEADREPAPAQQLGGLGLADVVLCAPSFEPNHHRRKLSRHRYG